MMQEPQAGESVASSVRKTLTNLAAMTDELEQRESSLDKIRSLTQDLEAYEADLERSHKLLQWLEAQKDCELGWSDVTDEWIVYRSGDPVGHGSSPQSALAQAANVRTIGQ